ncbi:adenosine deaminase [uncultured Aliiroseovarius sp.]|uniref:adenosine deaminase n=1 Tax=uncultured Aliiroseovarius sp. TaxID=1658783 RepID=UPI00262FB64B|nr:adenosine deaminase [uncultured Aliiroseovarius sp.]
MSFKALPKVELHLHIEGAAPPEFIRGLAKEKHVDLSGIFTDDGGYAYRDFSHFLEVYEAATSVLKSPEDFGRLTKAVLEDCAEAGVVYAETFLSPDFCGGRDVGAWREYLAAIQEAAAECERDAGITLRGIVTAIRHFGPEPARETAICAQQTAGDFITGFGMGGDENAGKQGDFAYAFDMAREAGLRLTTHAGEWRGPDEVRAALDDLKVERIGHGVRSIEDLTLVERLVEDDITLEVCPGSNVFLGVYPDLSAHPIAKLRERGVKVTVSTDDPPFFRTDLVTEYENLSRQFGWETSDFNALNLTAIDAAFCDDATRARVRKKLETQDV